MLPRNFPLRLTTSGLGGVMRWVLQYGSHAKVLAPDALRKAVAAETSAMAERYGPPASD